MAIGAAPALDPVLQKRCIGPAKLGYFVLAVDAFGAGERGLEKKLGEYHGEMVAATLLPAGHTLAGFQVYENMRAVDYLLTRPEVDGKKIAITGASGGGNGPCTPALGRSLRRVVPVCSVGNYQAYRHGLHVRNRPGRAAHRRGRHPWHDGAARPHGGQRDQGWRHSPSRKPKSLAFASSVYKVHNKPDSSPHDLRLASRLQPGHARGTLRLAGEKPQGQGRR